MPGWWRRWRRAARIRAAHRLLNLMDGGDAELTERFRRIAGEIAARSTEARIQAQAEALHATLAEAQHTAVNVKLLAERLARQHAESLPERPVPARPWRFGLTGRICRQVDLERPWTRHWLAQLGSTGTYHRKAWENAFVLQGLWEAGMLAPGRRGLGFAVGREPLPSMFIARGAEVLATDLDAGDTRAADWISTNQNAARVEDLHWPRLVDREAFLARCAFRAVDMNALPADLREGRFDFVWSSCSFEHLGSIERGLDFVVAAMDCLAPGGVAVHTTELQLDDDAPPVDDRGTVLFRRRDMEALAERLAARGHEMAPIDYGPGLGLLDGYVDVPPYGARRGTGLPPVHPPHLRVSVYGVAATSVGLIIRAGGAKPGT
jgi:hypothetical protein